MKEAGDSKSLELSALRSFIEKDLEQNYDTEKQLAGDMAAGLDRFSANGYDGLRLEACREYEGENRKFILKVYEIFKGKISIEDIEKETAVYPTFKVIAEKCH